MSETTTLQDTATADSGKWGQYYDPVLAQSPVIQKIIAESCSMNGGTAAVLLQIASRGVGLGVAAHSSFTKRPVERARRSLVYIYAMAFGTQAERRIVTDATHRAHSRVKGANYDADDVDLQLWVAATMYWSLITGYEEIFGKLDEDMAEQAYKEFSVMATGLRVPPGRWPKDRRAFQEYWDKTIAELDITQPAKAVAQDVIYPAGHLPSWGLWLYAKVTGPSTRIMTTELLPERIRNEFGMPSTVYTRTMYGLSRGMNRLLYPWLPESVRHYPKNHYMQDFRSRVERGARL
ncbi:hypothetical protein PFICI_04753 [Pestalotiopsis fici W106-1]|uniref:ER-bound oxygenase mpaB/mpaB'/Rubber oxygenase catalytic domain-containing protein n=1 Tax=Pestalotiopsis fici (strain W106-1 / CGMCC3.15140) TaxID=1229662 RepID=W3XBS5_PESFW|nr:uncharacterized protein PFICI_04753 [Pestalotiopsis fici W106-1]ETS82877.1 hypothetical protein PFICI_04753 [Pestalotiopsis fici W106-1]